MSKPTYNLESGEYCPGDPLLTDGDEDAQDLKARAELMARLARPYRDHPLVQSKPHDDRQHLALLFHTTLAFLRQRAGDLPVDFARDRDRVASVFLGALSVAWDDLIAPKLFTVSPMTTPVDHDLQNRPIVANASAHVDGDKLTRRLVKALSHGDADPGVQHQLTFLLGKHLAACLNRLHIETLLREAPASVLQVDTEDNLTTRMGAVLGPTGAESWIVAHPLWVQSLEGECDASKEVGFAHFAKGAPGASLTVVYADFMPTYTALIGLKSTRAYPTVGWHPYLPLVMYADCEARSREHLKIYDPKALLKLSMEG